MGHPITQRAKCQYKDMPINGEVTIDAGGKQRANFPSSAPRSMAKFLPESGLVDDNTLSNLGFNVNAGNNTAVIEPNETLINGGSQTQGVAQGSGDGSETTVGVGQGASSSQGDNPSGDQGEDKKIDLTKPFGGGEYTSSGRQQNRELTGAQGRATMQNARQQARKAGLKGKDRRDYLRGEREKVRETRREARRNWLGANAASAPPNTNSAANKRVSTPLNMWGTAKLQFGQKK